MFCAKLATFTFGLGNALAAYAQQAPTTRPNLTAGKEAFHSYCSVCHGLGAKGDGPAAESLRTPPADLTTLNDRNAGKFPADRVRDSIYSRGAIPAHGTPDMPMWGDVFHNLKGDQRLIRALERNLSAYIESLQTAAK